MFFNGHLIIIPALQVSSEKKQDIGLKLYLIDILFMLSFSMTKDNCRNMCQKFLAVLEKLFNCFPSSPVINSYKTVIRYCFLCPFSDFGFWVRTCALSIPPPPPSREKACML